jgi:Cu-Zn family superoxide dismutase
MNGICVLHKNENGVTGIVKFIQDNKRVTVSYEIKGLKDGLHGFHVHEYGDLTDKCNSTCAHFNPNNKTHGGRNSKESHVGDLGNIKSKNNLAKGSFYDNKISLDYKSMYCIVGRSIIVHEDRDDLGRGNNDETLKTGNAGKRMACGVIGITNKC